MDERVEKLKQDGMDMWGEAMEHGGRYLLPRRLSKPGSDPKTDALYDAAGWLCMEGYARWIDRSSNMWPGIELTGRPYA